MRNFFRHSFRLLLIMILCAGQVLLTSCSALSAQSQSGAQSVGWTDLFDTYVSFTAYGLDETAFSEAASSLHQLLADFHQETDIYHGYEDVTNLYSVNRAAATGEACCVSETLFDFLVFCVNAEEATGGRINVMLGSVTSLWQQTRTDSQLPSEEALAEASSHTDIQLLQLSDSDHTVKMADPSASLDVGALAKGYAGRLAMAFLEEQGIDNYLLDLGGNLCCHGKPLGTGRDTFRIGIQDPSAASGTYSEVVELAGGCAVTSGDYQRYVEIDGVRYHHIIDPDTLYPGTLHHSVTVLADDPAIADMLSTALFLMDQEEGLALAERYQAEVIYLD